MTIAMVIMEGIIMSFWLMLVCVVGISNGVEGMVCLYEKDVQSLFRIFTKEKKGSKIREKEKR